jgi:hypothetical protein
MEASATMIADGSLTADLSLPTLRGVQ